MERTLPTIRIEFPQPDITNQPPDSSAAPINRAASSEGSPLITHSLRQNGTGLVSTNPDRRSRLLFPLLLLIGVSIALLGTALSRPSSTSQADTPKTRGGAVVSPRDAKPLSFAPLPEQRSGLVTVNETDKSQLFYWYFPPENGDPDAPLILWLQGGPGASGLIGLFHEIGPYSLVQNEQGHVSLGRREVSWTKDFGVIFVDSPVGTGYSVAGSPEGYSRNQEQVSSNLYTFLQWFFRAYPEELQRKFYIVAESYGGHFGPNLAVHILEQNRRIQAAQGKAEGVEIRMSGLAIQDGLVDPPVQVLEKPAAAFYFSLITPEQLSRAEALSAASSRLALEGKTGEALTKREEMEEIIRQASGVNLLDVRVFGALGLDESIGAWANDPANKAVLHIPERVTWRTDTAVQEALTEDVMVSYAHKVVSVLDEWHLPVLLFQGQFDLKDGVRANQAWARRMQWSGREAFLAAPYDRWYVGDDLERPAGWAQEAGLLSEVVVAGAGHLAPMTQPLACLDAVTRWIEGRPFRHHAAQG